jgi:hypothetical protein
LRSNGEEPAVTAKSAHGYFSQPRVTAITVSRSVSFQTDVIPNAREARVRNPLLFYQQTRKNVH